MVLFNTLLLTGRSYSDIPA